MLQTLILAACVAAAASAAAQPPLRPEGIDRAFARLYSYDFPGAHAVLDEEARVRPDDPLVYAVRGAAYLFTEFERQHILEMQFFEDDDKVTDRKRLKPDPAARARVFEATAAARKLANARLATHPADRNALFALCAAVGIETDYTGLIEKRYFKTYSLSKEAQKHARRLLALDPPDYDAYMTIGTVEYVVSKLNFFFRLFVRFDQIEGSKQKAMADLELVVKYGHYYRPFSKMLLAAIHLRENRPGPALALLKELDGEFPGNPLIRKEITRAEGKVRLASATPR
jgi:hypothetical protein